MKQVSTFTASSNAVEQSSTDSTEEFFIREIKQLKYDLFRVANSILRNYADAEDAVSESILKAYDKRNSLKTKEKFKPWIMKILVRECYAMRRKSREIACDDSVPVAAEHSFEESSYELWDILCQLPEEFRVVTVLFYYEDLEVKEIAKILRLAEGTVKSRLSRAREKLRKLFDASHNLRGESNDNEL